MPTDDLLVRLINHRVSDDTARWEDYLTECFAWLLENDPGLRATLLGKGGLLVGKCGPCHTYEPNASIKTQVTLPDQCRPDITISGERTTILIECKVGAPYDSEQIGQYLSHARLRAEAYVVAIVPARSVPFNSGHDGAERFLGIVTWESVSQAIVDAEPTGNVGDDFRGWFLQLLKQYQLVPHAGPLHWEKDNGEQDVEGVKKLCGVFDGAVNRIQGDPSQLGHIPRLYRQPDRGVNLTTVVRVSGGGTSPRPILHYDVLLKSRYSPFMDLRLDTYFLQPSYLRPMAEPMVTAAVITKGWKDAPFAEDVAGILGYLGQYHQPERPEEVREVFLTGLSGALERLRDSLPPSIPVTEHKVQRVWALTIPLAPTSALCGSGMEAEALTQRFEMWLRSLLMGWFRTDPERPLANLVMSVMLP
ncbi:MAG: hypothetical protein AUK47_13405 [Deltaproteobacteria bacterium CG2_30_63_29]|nr:MAG: hypothetical protein AUK47_13405 [Deltaproteobacteria bacterium CG2_30_63_29]